MNSPVKNSGAGLSARLHNQRYYLSILAAILILLAAPYPWLSRLAYHGTPAAHETIEIIGAIFGLVAGHAFISHFYALGNRFYLFIGLAYFINAAEDLIHGLFAFFSSQKIMELPASTFSHFIPGTYSTGRLVMGCILILAPFIPKLWQKTENPRQETIWVSLIVLFITMSATGLAVLLPLPGFVYPERFISRPADFLSAIVFLIAFIIFLRIYIKEGKSLVWWITLSIGVNIIGQLFMSFSRQLYGSKFDVAHLYKILGYAIPMLGFSLYQITLIHEQKQAEKEIRKLNQELEQRVAERTAQLERVNKELSEFVYIAAHDLKAPLRGLIQLSVWVVEDCGKILDKESREKLLLIKSSAQKMQNLIEGVLKYSSAGESESEKETIDLNSLVADIIKTLDCPSRITIKIENSLPCIYFDRIQIGQVFQNLLDNAIKFMDKEKGEISISSRDKGTYWEFCIADNGPGIKSEYFERIFNMFQTISKPTANSTGIGLPIVKKIIQAQNGKVWVESEVNKGSKFFFTILKPREIPQENNL